MNLVFEETKVAADATTKANSGSTTAGGLRYSLNDS